MTARTRKSSTAAKSTPDTEGGTESTADATPDAPMQGPAGATEVVTEVVLGPEDHTVAATDAPTPLGQAHDVEASAEKSSSSDDDGEKSGTRYLNVSGGPLVYDDEGHSVDQDTWTPPVNLDAVGRGLRDLGYLKSRTALGLT